MSFGTAIRTKGKIIGLLAFSFFVVAFFDYLSGAEVSFSIFYLLPISIAAWHLGMAAAIIMSVVSAIMWFLNDSVFTEHIYTNMAAPYWNSLVRFGFFIINSITLSKLKRSRDAEKRQYDELAAAHLELDRTRQEQLLIKDRVLSNVSHELKTPLTAIHQFLSILLDGIAGKLSADQEQYLQIAFRNVNQPNQMINDILDSTRVESGKLSFNFTASSLPELAGDLLRNLYSLFAEKNLNLATSIAPQLPPMLADPNRVRQVLINLMDNAAKFTPPNGEVKIEASLCPEDAGFLVVSVSDTGVGIGPEQQKHIFQRLYQASQNEDGSRKGLGLGL